MLPEVNGTVPLGLTEGVVDMFQVVKALRVQKPGAYILTVITVSTARCACKLIITICTCTCTVRVTYM